MSNVNARTLNYVEQITQFLNSSKKNLSKERYEDLQQKQAESMVERFMNIGVEMDMVGQLSDLISKGPWTSKQKEDLQLAVSEAIDKDMPGKSQQRRPNQTCRHFNPYFSRQDCEVLADQSMSFVDKLDRIAVRAAPWAEVKLQLTSVGPRFCNPLSCGHMRLSVCLRRAL